MTRRRFVQSDVARAIRGAIKGGGSPSGVEIDHAGKIVVFLGMRLRLPTPTTSAI